MINKLSLLVMLAIVGFIGLSVYYNYFGTHSEESYGHYPSWRSATEISSHGSGYVSPSPTVTVIVALKNDCTNCQAILDHLQGKHIILKKLNVDNPKDFSILKSELAKRGVDYVGVPTVIIGDLVFYSYQTSEQCPYINQTESTEVNLKVGKETVTFCRVPDYTRYFIYIPSQIDTYLALCDKYKDNVCYE